MTETVIYKWRGQDRRGTARTGQSRFADLPAEVEARYQKGWRSLAVFLGGDEVAGISPHPDTGKRCWWAAR